MSKETVVKSDFDVAAYKQRLAKFDATGFNRALALFYGCEAGDEVGEAELRKRLDGAGMRYHETLKGAATPNRRRVMADMYRGFAG